MKSLDKKLNKPILCLEKRKAVVFFNGCTKSKIGLKLGFPFATMLGSSTCSKAIKKTREINLLNLLQTNVSLLCLL